MPIVNTNLRHATSSLRPSSTKSPNKSTNPKEKHYSGEVDDRDDPDEHDDDYDDHYYSEDFNPFEGPFIEENDSKEQASKDYKEKKGNEYFYKERKEKSLADASDKSKKNSTEKYVANPSKNNFAYSKQKQTTTSTTQATVTRNCSPDSKVNYHYHMYMIKKVAGEQKKQKKGTMKKHTMPTSVHPVYQSLNSDASSQSLHQLQAPAPSSSHDLLVYDSQAEKAPSAFSYEQGKDDSLSDFYYQVVTSSSYIEPPGSYLQASPNGAHKSATPQAVSHFDSDYYNNVLISKILGMNQMQKVMPLENYATERNGVAPLVTYEKLKNSKPVEFEYDENSKLYVTPGKGKSSEATKKKPPKGKHWHEQRQLLHSFQHPPFVRIYILFILTHP